MLQVKVDPLIEQQVIKRFQNAVFQHEPGTENPLRRSNENGLQQHNFPMLLLLKRQNIKAIVKLDQHPVARAILCAEIQRAQILEKRLIHCAGNSRIIIFFLLNYKYTFRFVIHIMSPYNTSQA